MISDNKKKKVGLVKTLSDDLRKATSVVLVDYAGMGVNVQESLRNALREVGARMIVAKNSLVKRAGVSAKLSKEMLTDEIMVGQNAIIVGGQDPIAPLQVLGKFVKEFELPKIKVGIMEGSFQDAEGIITLSKLPGKDVLYGRVVGTVAAPAVGLVGVLNANMQKLIMVLNAKVGKGS